LDDARGSIGAMIDDTTARHSTLQASEKDRVRAKNEAGLLVNFTPFVKEQRLIMEIAHMRVADGLPETVDANGESIDLQNRIQDDRGTVSLLGTSEGTAVPLDVSVMSRDLLDRLAPKFIPQLGCGDLVIRFLTGIPGQQQARLVGAQRICLEDVGGDDIRVGHG
jgi:hypothetical protein